MNAATAQLVTLTSGKEDEIDYTAVGSAINQMYVNVVLLICYICQWRVCLSVFVCLCVCRCVCVCVLCECVKKSVCVCARERE